MSYRSTTEFGALAAELLADLERFRPGIPETASEEEIRQKCAERVRLRLPEVFAEYQADVDSHDAAAQLALYEREMTQLLVPRYAALAERQNRSERRRSTGGIDLYNRVTYAAIFFIIGVLVVWAPFIPLWDKWIPFALALIAPFVSPWLPDLHLQLLKRRHDISLGMLHMDLDSAGRSLPLPPAALPAAATVNPAAVKERSTQKQ